MWDKIKDKYWTTVIINLKTLRFNFMNYFMLVFLFPFSYFVIYMLGSKGKTPAINYIVGMFLTMLLSMFINMFATLVSSANRVELFEMFKTYQVDTLDVFRGEGIFHMILSLFLLIVGVVIAVFNGFRPDILKLCFLQMLFFAFLTELGIFIGGLLRDPNMAQAFINCFYMLVVILTPVYQSPDSLGKIQYIYSINPIAHIGWLYYWSFGGKKGYVEPAAGIVYLLLLTLILIWFNNKRWSKAVSREKIGI
jgi:hypothetical protein